MTAPILTTVTFESVTGLPEDRIVNTFPFQWQGAGLPTTTDFSNLSNDVREFYIVQGTTNAVEFYLSDEISRAAGGMVIRHYDLTGHLDGSPHGSPLHTSISNLLGAGNGTDLPGECACVLTTRAIGWETAQVEVADGPDPGTALDRPRQRLSGRVYIGPLTTACMGVVGGITRLTTGFITDLLDAADALEGSAGADQFEWSVWSRVNAALVSITHFQVDNAFDTQRRRGAAPSVRTTRAA